MLAIAFALLVVAVNATGASSTPEQITATVGAGAGGSGSFTATGPFSGSGTATSVGFGTRPGNVTPGSSRLECDRSRYRLDIVEDLALAGGKIRLHALVSNRTRTCDLGTCGIHEVWTGSAVKRSESTGQYVTMQGHGRVTITFDWHASFPGGCDFRFTTFGDERIELTGSLRQH